MMYLNFFDKMFVRMGNVPDGKFETFLREKFPYYVKDDTYSYDGESAISINIVPKLAVSGIQRIDNRAGFAGNNFYILDRSSKKLKSDLQKTLFVEQGFNVYDFYEFFKLFLMVRLNSSGILPIHSSSFSHKGESIMLMGPGGVGKTRLLLKFLQEGAEFISDDWTLIDQEYAHAFADEILLCNYDQKIFSRYVQVPLIDRLRMGITHWPQDNLFGKVMLKGKLGLKGKIYSSSRMFERTQHHVRLKKIYYLVQNKENQIKTSPVDTGEMASSMAEVFLREHQTYWRYLDCYVSDNPAKPHDSQKEYIRKNYIARIKTIFSGLTVEQISVPQRLDYQSLNLQRDLCIQ